MVEQLLALNPNEHIIILDNDSSYPPLLEWYEGIMNNPNYHIQVIFKGNEGHLALWGIGLDKELGDFFCFVGFVFVYLQMKKLKEWNWAIFFADINHNKRLLPAFLLLKALINFIQTKKLNHGNNNPGSKTNQPKYNWIG
jgi:hypothetical protein